MVDAGISSPQCWALQEQSNKGARIARIHSHVIILC